MKKIKNGWKKAGIITSILTLGIIMGIAMNLISFSSDIPNVVEHNQVVEAKERAWKAVGDADPGAGAGGVLVVFIYPHDATPATTYATNCTPGTAYEYNDGLNANLGNNVPHTTTFDIVVKVRYNETQAKNTSNGTKGWDMTWVRGLITCADLSISSDTVMAKAEVTGNTTEFVWVQFYMNNGGSGYTISHGEGVNVTSFKQQAYY